MFSVLSISFRDVFHRKILYKIQILGAQVENVVQFWIADRN